MPSKGKDYDVFLSHNSADKAAVEILASRLIGEAHLSPFLDKWHLVPGNPWQEELEQALDRSDTCAVFIGPKGLGPWHNEEMQSALDDRVHNPRFRVVPVLLPGATLPERGQLPRFLRRLTWVDFRTPQGLHDAGAFHRLVAGIRGIPPGADGSGTPSAATIKCPYRGLEVFDEEHVSFFFGREADTQHLIEVLRDTRFLAVVGPSGSGKSSLVRAGLLPQLRLGALPQSNHWRYSIFKPGAHPMEELAVSVSQLTGRPDVQSFLNSLEADERELHLQVRLLLRGQPEGTRVCVIVDQFEELFTLCQSPTERQHFISTLRYAINVVGGQIVVIPTLQADFIARAAEQAVLAELLSGHQFLVSPMEAEDLLRVIEEPARLVKAKLEDGLAKQMLHDTGQEPGALPLLEHALLQMWEQRRPGNVLTFAAYTDIGGVQGSLANHAEQVFEKLSLEQQHLVRQVLLRLTQPGEGTENTRRRATMEELQTQGANRTAIETVVKALADARLLVTTGADKAEIVDVAHEALIRGWPRLRGWIQEDPSALRTHRRITEGAQEWNRLQQDEGVLFRGALLAVTQEWRVQHEQDLNALERQFLDASIELTIREKEQERQRQERERKFLQELAEEQRQRAEAERERALAEQQRADTQATTVKRLRIGAAVLMVAMLIAVGAALFAWNQQQRAQTLLAQNYWASGVNAKKQGDWLQALHYFARSVQSGDEPAQIKNALLNIQGYPKATFLASQLPHDGSLLGASFNSDGSLVLTWSSDKTARLWRAVDGTPVGQPLRHDDSLWGARFNPDESLILTWSSDKTARLWRAVDGTPVGQPLRHDDSVFGVSALILMGH